MRVGRHHLQKVTIERTGQKQQKKHKQGKACATDRATGRKLLWIFGVSGD